MSRSTDANLNRNGRPYGALNRKTLEARDVLMNVSKMAASQLAELVNSPHPCPLCNRGYVNLKAVEMILDRTGLGPKVTIEQETPDTDWMAWLTEEQLDVLNNMIDEAKERMGEARDADGQARSLIGEEVARPTPDSLATANEPPALPPGTDLVQQTEADPEGEEII